MCGCADVQLSLWHDIIIKRISRKYLHSFACLTRSFRVYTVYVFMMLPGLSSSGRWEKNMLYFFLPSLNKKAAGGNEKKISERSFIEQFQLAKDFIGGRIRRRREKRNFPNFPILDVSLILSHVDGGRKKELYSIPSIVSRCHVLLISPTEKRDREMFNKGTHVLQF